MSQTHPTIQQDAVESCCELHPPRACPSTPCPECGAQGKTVPRLTLGALLRPEHRPQIPAQDAFCFCRTPTCEAVYFVPGRVVFRKSELSVRVGLKEPNDPTAPACYCFGWTPEKIREELAATGSSTVIDQIKAQVKAGNCYCEVTNPQGSCCLGNVAKVVQETMTVSQKGGVGK
ncbi:MAG: copper chaperone Copz family protein [Candidatus Omnitrophica bacterium]|nr:copper chaperone Copz family protein [Candidatus Omnitrophota bacterium]